jgi:hypothetical protein
MKIFQKIFANPIYATKISTNKNFSYSMKKIKNLTSIYQIIRTNSEKSCEHYCQGHKKFHTCLQEEKKVCAEKSGCIHSPEAGQCRLAQKLLLEYPANQERSSESSKGIAI